MLGPNINHPAMRVVLLFIFIGIFHLRPRAQELQQTQETGDVLKQSSVTIRNISISGNKQTKQYIITRELAFRNGNAYPMRDILTGLETSRQNLMNTTLFVEVNVCFSNWNNDSLDIIVDVKERWYYFVFPYMKPADRNWNVWINDYNFDPERVNYGLKFHGKNITGRNDKLNAWIINGYTQRLAINYYNPFSDNSLRRGWGIDVSYSRNREINYQTSNNRQQFYKNELNFIRKQVYFGGVYSYRKGSIERHYVKLGMQTEAVSDTVAKLNPNYLGAGRTKLFYPELKYTYQYFDMNYIPYPTRGVSFELELIRRGINGQVNLTQLQVKAARYFELPKKFYFSAAAEMHLRVPFDQPFFNQLMLGYNDSYLRGMEYYVVDGVAGGFVRNTVGREIFNYRFKTGLKSKTYSSVPFRFYLKAYGDFGYVYNKRMQFSNTLNNTFLYTGGIGVDVISIYDVVLRFEYSFNQFRERGIFIHKSDLKN